MNADDPRQSKTKAMDNGSVTEKATMKAFSTWWSPRKRQSRGVEEDLSVDFSQSVTTNMDELSLGCSPDQIESHPLYAVIEEYMIRDPRVRALIEGLDVDDDEEEDEDSADTHDDGSDTHGSSLDDESTTSYYDEESSGGSSIMESIDAASEAKVATKPRGETTEEAPTTTIFMSSQHEATSPLGLTPSIMSTECALLSVRQEPDKASRDNSSRGLKKTRWPTFGKYRSKDRTSEDQPGKGDKTKTEKPLKNTPGTSPLTSIESSKPELLKTVTSQDSVKDFMRALILEEETEIVFDNKSNEGEGDVSSPSYLWGNVKLWEKWRDRSPENKRKPQSEKDHPIMVARSESTAPVRNTSRVLNTEPTSSKTGDETTSSLQSSSNSSKYCRLPEKHQSVLDILATSSEASVDLSLIGDPTHTMRKLEALKKRHSSIREILALPSYESIPVEPESAEKEYEKLKAKLRSIRSILASPQQLRDNSKSVEEWPSKPSERETSSLTGVDHRTSSKTTESQENIEETTCSKKRKSAAKGLKIRLSKGKGGEKSTSKKVLQPKALETQAASNGTPHINKSTLQSSKFPDSENQQKPSGKVGKGDLLHQTRDVNVGIADVHAKPDRKAKQKRVNLAMTHKSRRSSDMKSLRTDKTTDRVDFKRCQESVGETGIEVAVGSVEGDGIDGNSNHKQSDKVDCSKDCKTKLSNIGHNRANGDDLKHKRQNEHKAAGGVKQKIDGRNNRVEIIDQEKIGNRQSQKTDRKKEKKGGSNKNEDDRAKCVKKSCGDYVGEPKPGNKANLASKVRATQPHHNKPDLELELRSSSLSNDETQKRTDLAVPSNGKNDATKEVADEATEHKRSITRTDLIPINGKRRDKDGGNPKAACASAPAEKTGMRALQKKFDEQACRKVESPTDPTADASLVAEMVKEMNIVEKKTEPEEQISGKAPLSIYRFLDFNPCHSELPASPRSRRAENVVIKGLCSADNDVLKEIPVSNRCRPEMAAPRSRSDLSLTPSASGWLSQGDETPRATNRNFVGNPCGDEQSGLNNSPQPDKSLKDISSKNQCLRNAFECSERQTKDRCVSQNLIREVLFCSMDQSQTDVQSSKSNCSRTSKTSVVTFKEGLIDDSPRRSRSDGLSTTKGRQPSVLRRRLKHGKQSDEICDESIEMLDDFNDAFDELVSNVHQSTAASEHQADASTNQMTLVQKMKRSLRKTPNGSQASPAKSFPRDSSDVRDDSETQMFIRTASEPSAWSASEATTQNRLAMIRDEYTRTRSMPLDCGKTAGDIGGGYNPSRVSNKVSEIREEYKKARKLDQNSETRSVRSVDSELNEEEKAAARRLANDLMILSKIARKRAKMRQLDKEPKEKDIGRNSELVKDSRKRHHVDDDSCSDAGSESEGTATTPTTPFSVAGVFDWLFIPDNTGK